MADYSQFKFGNTVYPLTPSLTNTLLKDTNPALYYAFDYLIGMIRLKCEDCWNAEVTAAGLPALSGIIKTIAPYNPMRHLKNVQTKFPMLSVWETNSETEELTLTKYHVKKTWNLLYSLPPLTAAQEDRLGPILYAVDETIRHAIEQGFDSDYQTGQEVWSEAFSGLDLIALSKTQFGTLPGLPDAQMIMPTLFQTIQISVSQRFDPSFFEKLVGIDVTQQLDGTDFIEIEIPIT